MFLLPLLLSPDTPAAWAADPKDRHGLRVLRRCLFGLLIGSAAMTAYRVLAGPVAVFRFFLVLTVIIALLVWGIEPAARFVRGPRR